MKILTLDVGNTTIHACIYLGELISLGRFIPPLLPTGRFENVFVSCVKPSLNRFILESFPNAKFITSVPIKSFCSNVGLDRLLCALGAITHYGENVIIVNLGTAITIDLCINGVFYGGLILNGLYSSLNCIHLRIPHLPSLKPKKVQILPAKDTVSAMLSGNFGSVFALLKHCKESWQELFGHSLITLITGGDGHLLSEFGLYDPLLIHRGMLSALKIQ
ncbi:MAG: type III pantothenate kinase [Aquificaceae bacterium]|nr:type III pantothenate kinase [Aquificaceae bacterium]MDW8237723.1 type III pantothenate kinase [Aquificaceae bacterium]